MVQQLALEASFRTVARCDLRREREHAALPNVQLCSCTDLSNVQPFQPFTAGAARIIAIMVVYKVAKVRPCACKLKVQLLSVKVVFSLNALDLF